MEALWTRGSASIREIQESFPEKNRPAYTTIQTMVYRLEGKKAVRRVRKVGNFHVFEAAVSRNAAQRRLIDDLLTLFGGRTQPVMAHLIESGRADARGREGSRENPPQAGAKGQSEMTDYLSSIWAAMATGAGQSFVAVHHLRRCGRTADIDVAQEPRAGPLLAVAGSVSEVSGALFIADRDGQLSALVASPIRRFVFVLKKKKIFSTSFSYICTDGSVVRVEILRDGVQEQVETKRSRQTIGFYTDPIVEFPFPPFAEVRPGIFYVNVPSISTSVLELRLPELATARGVIFDQHRDGRIRMNVAFPALSIRPHEQIIPHLVNETIHAPPMRIPRITQPDRVGWTWSESAWPVEPKAPRINGCVVFINDPMVGSYGETCMAMIADYALAKLVGARRPAATAISIPLRCPVVFASSGRGWKC